MSLLRYSLRRLLLLVPTLFGVTVVAFVLLRVLPGDPIATILGQTAGEEEIAAAHARFGLDKPIIVQFWDYLTNLVTGDLGTSIQSGRPVRDEILDRIGPTLELVILGVGIAVVCALVFGVWSAMRVNRPIDHGIRITSLVGNSVPDFWLGLLLILVFYASLGWAPAPSGRVDGDVGLEQITGSGIVDSIITGNVAALRSVLAHLALAGDHARHRRHRAAAAQRAGIGAGGARLGCLCRRRRPRHAAAPADHRATCCAPRWCACPPSPPSSSASRSARSCSSSRSTRGRGSGSGRCAACSTATTRWSRPPSS